MLRRSFSSDSKKGLDFLLDFTNKPTSSSESAFKKSPLTSKSYEQTYKRMPIRTVLNDRTAPPKREYQPSFLNKGDILSHKPVIESRSISIGKITENVEKVIVGSVSKSYEITRQTLSKSAATEEKSEPFISLAINSPIKNTESLNQTREKLSNNIFSHTNLSDFLNETSPNFNESTKYPARTVTPDRGVETETYVRKVDTIPVKRQLLKPRKGWNNLQDSPQKDKWQSFLESLERPPIEQLEETQRKARTPAERKPSPLDRKLFQLDRTGHASSNPVTTPTKAQKSADVNPVGWTPFAKAKQSAESIRSGWAPNAKQSPRSPIKGTSPRNQIDQEEIDEPVQIDQLDETSHIDPEKQERKRMYELKMAKAARDRPEKEVAEKKREIKAKTYRNFSRKASSIQIPDDGITIANLAAQLAKTMKKQGFESVEPNILLNGEMATILANEYNIEVINPSDTTPRLLPRPQPDSWDSFPARAPVVTIMGHVDHGKTSLLDALRSTSVAAGEAGGITQHIGAFSVVLASGKRITFLDTPGHAAFDKMRARGANCTDIIVLVVAGDDGVMPQTIEAINHAHEANGKRLIYSVPIIVAINKCDKPGIDVKRVQQGLMAHGVVVEEYGGDVQQVKTSALNKTGLDELEDAIVTLAEVVDIRGDPTGYVEGVVIESRLEKGRGNTTNMLVTRGTLKPGCVLVAGTHWAKVRTIFDEKGKSIKEAGPSTPVQVTGWKSLPSAGDLVLETEEDKAKMYIEHRVIANEKKEMIKSIDMLNESRMAHLRNRTDLKRGLVSQEEAPVIPTLSIVLRADVHGSLEAIQGAIQGLPQHQVKVVVASCGVGDVTSSDIDIASSTQSHIIAFNVTADKRVQSHAARLKTRIDRFDVIYNLLDAVKDLMAMQLPIEYLEEVKGEADILQMFEINVKKTVDRVAGCRVTLGKIHRALHVRVMRGELCVWKGPLKTLRHIKKDITEAVKGSECGMGFEGFQDFLPGDKVQSFTLVEKERRIG